MRPVRPPSRRDVLPVLDHLRRMRAACKARGCPDRHLSLQRVGLARFPAKSADLAHCFAAGSDHARNPARQPQKGVAMIELFTWPTPNGTKPSIMLEEVGAPYSSTA